MPYMFVPPQRVQRDRLKGSLTFSYPVSQTVWKDSTGTWRAMETPGADLLENCQRLLSLGGRPEVVDDATAAELIEAGIGTCTPIDLSGLT